MDVDDGGIDSGALGTPATPATPVRGGGAVGESPIRAALAAAAARRFAATSSGTPTSAPDAMKEDAPASNGNGANGKGVIKGDGVPAIDQATLESIDHRRGECTAGLRGYPTTMLRYHDVTLHRHGHKARLAYMRAMPWFTQGLHPVPPPSLLQPQIPRLTEVLT